MRQVDEEHCFRFSIKTEQNTEFSLMGMMQSVVAEPTFWSQFTLTLLLLNTLFHGGEEKRPVGIDSSRPRGPAGPRRTHLLPSTLTP